MGEGLSVRAKTQGPGFGWRGRILCIRPAIWFFFSFSRVSLFVYMISGHWNLRGLGVGVEDRGMGSLGGECKSNGLRVRGRAFWSEWRVGVCFGD